MNDVLEGKQYAPTFKFHMNQDNHKVKHMRRYCLGNCNKQIIKGKVETYWRRQILTVSRF